MHSVVVSASYCGCECGGEGSIIATNRLPIGEATRTVGT
jgi:hypothetical protein